MTDRRPDREEYGSEPPLLVAGRDTVYTAQWALWDIYVVNYTGATIQWANPANHAVTYQSRWPQYFPPGAYEWGRNLCPILYGMSGYVSAEYAFANLELRLELLDAGAVVRKTARMTFDILSSDMGGVSGPAHGIMQAHGSALTSDKACWEFDKYGPLLPPDPTFIQSWCGMRLYFYPYPSTEAEFDQYPEVFLAQWPNVTWMTLGRP